MSQHSVDTLLEITREIMEKAAFCFLMTGGPPGAISARLMQPYAPEDDLVVHFGASGNSRKAQELQRDGRATVAYQLAEEGAYVALLGQATVETALALRQRYWRESFTAFWPEGPEEGDYAVLRFVPARIEVMHMERGVAPEPFGLRPAVLVKEDGAWRVSEDYP
ncbi:MAG: pyridoxamine 5'-phosphate oxidase family protein [Anaerolineae bacterium]|nr:pyridoxamine 5'-phosphate oxidase family protein [Anaerolineae bacterium]